MKVIDQTLLEKVIIERCRHSHKGDYGRLLLLGGTYPYGGAIIMSAIAGLDNTSFITTKILICQGKISFFYKK